MLIMLDMDALMPSLSFADQHLSSLRHSVLDSKKGDLHMFINDWRQRDIKLMAHAEGIVEFIDTDELKSVSKGILMLVYRQKVSFCWVLRRMN